MFLLPFYRRQALPNRGFWQQLTDYEEELAAMRSQRHSGPFSPQSHSGVFSPYSQQQNRHTSSRGRARGTPGSPVGGMPSYSDSEQPWNSQQMRDLNDMTPQNTYAYEGQRNMYMASEERANKYSSPHRGYDGYQHEEYQTHQEYQPYQYDQHETHQEYQPYQHDQPYQHSMTDSGYPGRDDRYSGRDVGVRASPPEGALDYWK
jgi:hypothetical protein